MLHFKTTLGWGQPELIRWYLNESCPRCRFDPSTCWPAVQCATTVLRLPLYVLIETLYLCLTTISSIVHHYFVVLYFPLFSWPLLWMQRMGLWLSISFDHWAVVIHDASDVWNPSCRRTSITWKTQANQ